MNNHFDWDKQYKSRQIERLAEFEAWYDRIHGLEARPYTQPICNMNLLSLSAYDFVFLKQCGVKPE